MLQGAGRRLPPRALVVPHESIAKIELLAKPPAGHPLTGHAAAPALIAGRSRARSALDRSYVAC